MGKKHTVGTVQAYLTSKTNNTTLSEQFHNPTGKDIDTPKTQIHNCSLSWRDKETSHASSYYEMIADFPTVSNTLTRNSVIIMNIIIIWIVFFYITDRQRRNTLPNMKRKHKHRRSIPPNVKEDELTMPSSLIKRMIKLPFIYPVKVSMIYCNIQLSFVDDIPITCNSKALESYEIITVERARVCVCVLRGGYCFKPTHQLFSYIKAWDEMMMIALH